MNILDVNRNTLANLYEQYPENLYGLSMDGNNLVYKGEYCDISNFNINDLLNGDTNFAASLSVLDAEDIFRIIRLHALGLDSTLENQQELKSEEKIEIIKSENPLMKNISMVKQIHHGFTEEYINIVDSQGIDHLYHKDRDNDVFAIYEQLKGRNPGVEITPDDLIAEMNRKLYEVDMEDSFDLLNKSTTSEDFANKLRRVCEPYRDNKSIRVYGNENHDIVIVRDLDDPSKHKIVTFDTNEYGDLVMMSHDQNVMGTDTSITRGDSTETTTDSSQVENPENEQEVIEKDEQKIIAKLIPTSEFYRLLNSPDELTKEERNSVDLYYGYFGDLILYEDYLLPELKTILYQFRHYVYELQYAEVPEGEVARELNPKQQEAITKAEEMELRVATVAPEEKTPEKVEENIKVLKKLMPANDYNPNDTGSVSIFQVLAFIIGVSIILTAITLYLIG